MSSYVPQRTFPAEQQRRMEDLTSGLGTKSAKIRALAAAGYSRGDTAAFLGIRYQHVRNVLGPMHAAAPGSGNGQPGSPGESGAPPLGVAAVDAEGRVTLPAAVIEALEVRPGDEIPWRLERDELTLMGRRAGLRFIQELVAQRSGAHTESWTDRFIQERREEAAREDEREHRG